MGRIIVSCVENIGQKNNFGSKAIFAKNTMSECKAIFSNYADTINKWKREIKNKNGFFWIGYGFHSGSYTAIAFLEALSIYEMVDLISNMRITVDYDKYREITNGLNMLPNIESEKGEKADGGCYYIYIVDDDLPHGEYIFDSTAIDKYENKNFFDPILNFVESVN